jgi:hypothetical protein
MGGIGIVNNPRSRRNRGRPALAHRLREQLADDGEVIDAGTPDELSAAIERFRADGVDVVAVNGGDGTGHLVLTELARAFGDAPLPRILLLRGGAMNTVAHGHGIAGGPERILAEVLERRRSGFPLRTAARDLLRVSSDGAPPRYGFIFGTGIVVAFLDEFYRAHNPSPAFAALLVARGIGSALLGGPFASELTRRARLRVATDGDEWEDASYLALAAGSTPDAGFGFRAFHRCGEQPGSFHAVGVTGTLGQLALSLPRLRHGRPWRRRVAQDEVARELVVEGEAPRYTIDGDLYAAERSVRVETGPPVEIVLP